MEEALAKHRRRYFIMEFDFDKLKNDIVSAGRDVGAKAKEAANAAKVKLDIHTKQDYLEKQYAELGKAYYAARQREEQFSDQAYFDTIREALEELEALNEELMDLQGAVVCSNCGMKQPDDNNYCKNCGASLHQ